MKKRDDTALPHYRAATHRAVDVAAGLIFRNGKLLVTQRYAGAHLGGLWEFPGGKRKPRETFRNCLARELREELGIEVAVTSLFETVTHKYPDKTVHLKFFICQLMRGEPQPLGCAALAWVDKEGLKKCQFPAADTRLLEKLPRKCKLWERGLLTAHRTD